MRLAWLTSAGVVAVAALVKVIAMTSSPSLHRWFLLPTALSLSVFTGESFAENNAIYIFPDFVLDYSCAGINFFVICSLTTAILLSNAGEISRPHTLFGYVVLWGRVALLIAAIYAATLLANFARVALYLRLLPLSEGRPWLHEAVGVAVFLSILICYATLLNRIQNAKQPTLS